LAFKLISNLPNDTSENTISINLHDCGFRKGQERNILPSLKAEGISESRSWYAVVKAVDVAASNQWYRTYPTAVRYNDNMGITYEYLKTHMAPDLWTKVNQSTTPIRPKLKVALSFSIS
jgi:hypothetical protein